MFLLFVFFLRDTSSVWYLFSALHFGMLICHDCHVLRIILQYVCDHSNHSNNRNLEGILWVLPQHTNSHSILKAGKAPFITNCQTHIFPTGTFGHGSFQGIASKR